MRNNQILENKIKKQNETILKIIIIIFSLLFFLRNFYYLFLKSEILLDNKIASYEENIIDFSKYTTNIKPILLFNYNIINIKKFVEEINLLKKHGIYGIGLNYMWDTRRNKEQNIDILLNNKNIAINFLLSLNASIIKNMGSSMVNAFILDLKKYFNDERYIKFNNKPILGLNIDFNYDLSEKEINFFKKQCFDEIFILANANDKNIDVFINKNIFDGIYYSPIYAELEKIIFKFNNTKNYFYTDLLYKNLDFKKNNNKNTLIFRTSTTSNNLNYKDINIYNDYNPEKFYFLNKIIIEWTLKNLPIENQFFFINNFNSNNQDINDFASLNTFSKALFHLPLISGNNFSNINNFQNGNTYIIIQAHVFYLDILPDIISKSNNIPVLFDLYISTDTEEKKSYIENYLARNKTKANKYSILLYPNKGRDIIPFLYQLKNIINKYKYICHIHTKKIGITSKIENEWRIYLFENLLGNKDIITKILLDFENNDKLGFIFPEHFHTQIKYIYNWNHSDKKQINYIFEILFPNENLKAGDTLDFPVGNMFWARTKAIYQVFDDKIIYNCPKEIGQFDGTMLHAIERLWLYLTKINGFFYKTYLNYVY